MELAPLFPARNSLLELIPEVYRVLAAWPGFDREKLSVTYRKRFDRLSKAAGMLLQFEPIKKVLQVAQVSVQQFSKLIRLAMTQRSDGKGVWGMRAFAAFKAQATRARIKEFSAHTKATAGFTGMFACLLETHPPIESGLIDYLNSRTRPNRTGRHELHREFLTLCRARGLLETDYPMCTASQAATPLHVWFQGVYLPRYGRRFAAREHGPDVAKALESGAAVEPTPRQHKVMGDWVMDEQSIDEFTRLRMPSMFGDYEQIDLHRVPIIRLRTVDFEIQLAWRLVLTKKVSAFDVLSVLWEAVSGPSKAQAVVPDLDYEEGAGFLASSFEQLRWTVPRVLYLDNALEHLADVIQQLVTRLWGGTVIVGIPGTPKGRPTIESSIRKHTKRVIQQLPGTTGSHPRDSRRKAAAVVPELLVEVPALVHTLDCYFANENVHSTDAAGALSPYTRVERLLSMGKLDLPSLPGHFRRAHWFSAPVPRPVCCDIDNGRLPHVNFMYSRYSSDLLQRHPGMRGHKLSLRPDYRNLQHVIAFDARGDEFGILTAEGAWGKVPHDARIKKVFGIHRKAGRLGPRADDEPMQRLFAYLQAGAPMDSRLATQLAYVFRYLTLNMTPEHFQSLLSDAASPEAEPDKAASWAVVVDAAKEAAAANEAGSLVNSLVDACDSSDVADGGGPIPSKASEPTRVASAPRLMVVPRRLAR